MKKLFAIWAFVLVIGVGMRYFASPRPAVSTSTEPFHIKANDALGIRLGMSLSDYKRLRKQESRECLKEDKDTEVFCPIVPTRDRNGDLPKITIGGPEIISYQLTFYERTLISIDYYLVSTSWSPLENALSEKFGYTKMSGNKQRWTNAISSLSFRTDPKDFSAATLKMQLDKNVNEWLERSSKRENEETKESL